ncbi:N-acetylglucosamine-6-phosphate deacetylase [Ahrensia sp. 13_GOM-1096m]|uniref:N-acetylglucosamine-6-phosphate deacetylase n=1 Tax=Ahrensia sp. 13_GOM-1096m TaxID=1380380 RepID=UPI0009DD5DB2|nr:N-acetylglucosamine-6-phosphate deacetylase [Ahrensia sp. 13_GOM-1096m]
MSTRKDQIVHSTSSTKSPTKIFARRLFDGTNDSHLENQIIEIRQGKIVDVRSSEPGEENSAGVISADIVAPGFIDIQINGANDIQFNDDVTVDALARMAYGARQGGTAYILPTFITAQDMQYVKAIDTVKVALRNKLPGILGLHLEGPFLSRERPGIHEKSCIRVMNDTDIAHLTEPFDGALLVTVAPETLPSKALNTLVDAGVMVFAGHSDASSDVMQQAEENGLRGTTHLFNAMSQLTVREPGVVGATLSSDSLYAGIIADGHHVNWMNIKIAVKQMSKRLCLVTDAMLTLAGARQEFTLHGETIRLRNGRLTNAEDRLAGAHVAMDQSVRNMVKNTDVPLSQALRMASRNPAEAIGYGHELGQVKRGFRASLSLLTEDLHASGVVVDGEYFEQVI